MSQDLRSLTDQVRSIPLEEVFAQRGISPRKEGASSRFKNDQVNVVVTGRDLWFDNAASIGGRGPIDLALHLHVGTNPKSPSTKQFRDAVLWLYELKGGLAPSFSPTGTPKAAETPIATFEEQKATWAIRDDDRWPLVRSYLVDIRRLPGKQVDELYRRDDLYPTFSERRPEATAACFIHRDLDGTPKGATLRSTNQASGFQQAIGSKTGAWFTLGESQQAERLIVTESPIDALSYRALHPGESGAVIAMGCSHVFEPILRLSQDRKSPLLVAFDNDGPGDQGFTQCVKEQRQLYPEGAEPVRIVPVRKDWNDDLRFSQPPRRSFSL